MAHYTHAVATTTVSFELDINHILRCANHAADLAGDICRKYFGKPVHTMDKEDGSPVTEADVEVEQTIREVIKKDFPACSICGEEMGFSVGEGEAKRYLWIIDPIDGTTSFITGKPTFCILIAVLCDGVPIVGIVDQPILRDRWTGAADHPTLRNGIPVHTRPTDGLISAYAYSYSYDTFARGRQKVFERLEPCVKELMWGADSYAYGLLASGMVDLVCDANLAVHDYMAFVPIVEGAGGVVTNWSGKKLVWDGVKLNGAPCWDTEIVAAGTPELHKEAIEIINWKA